MLVWHIQSKLYLGTMNILRLNGSENKGFIKLVAWSRAKRCVVDETLRCLTAYQLYHIDPVKNIAAIFQTMFWN